MQRTWASVAAAALVGSLLVTSAPATAQSVMSCSGNAGDSEVSEKGPFKIGEANVVELESKVDGSVIQIGYVRPDAPADYRSPVIMVGSPYFLTDLRDVDVTQCNDFLVQNFVPHGYTIAFVPTRGAGGTDSCADLMGPAERSDLDQAVTWLGSQEWSNGSVGMTGASYDGSTPWEVAAEGNPYLKTIVPVSGIHDIYEFVYERAHNDWRWWFFVAGYYHYYGQGQANPAGGRDADRWANAWMCESTEEALGATFESYLNGGAYDSYGYWKARNTNDEILERYRGSVLLVQGMQDWNVSPDHQWPFINELEKRGVYVEQMLGQWDHTFPDGGHDVGPRGDYADILLEWWDRWLKGDGSADLGPRVEVQDSDLKWRTETAWPPADTTTDKLYLSADNTLTSTPTKGESTALLGPGTRNRYFYVITDNMFIYNDTPVDHHCVDCAILTSTVEDELRIVGMPEVELRVTPTGQGGFVSAYLLRDEGDGVWDLLGWGAGDVRYPNGNGPQEVEPGKEIKLRFPLQPMDAVAHKGDQLILLLDQGHADHMPTAPFFPVELRYGKSLGSVEFETTRPDAADFFKPRGLPE